MASWKPYFQAGVSSFRAGKLQDALEHLSKAIILGCQDSNIYDSRAAVYEKLGNRKEALLDCKKVIELSPQRWQGYFRSARLFLGLRKFDKAEAMISLALERIKPGDDKRIVEMMALKKEIETSFDTFVQHQVQERAKSFYHFGKLPFEIAMVIFSMAIYDDPAKVIYLAQVCKDWRATILDSPSLWRVLVLTHRSPVRKLKEWRERCKRTLDQLMLRRTREAILDALHDFDLVRLRGLTIEGIDLSLNGNALSFITPSIICNLESLVVRSSLRAKHSWLWQHSLMQLQHLSMTLPHDIPWVTLSKNVVNLRTLSFHGPVHLWQCNSILFLLLSNPQLEALTLSTVQGSSIPSDEPETRELPSQISMPCLETIVLEGVGILFCDFMKKLCTPRLRKIAFGRTPENLEPMFSHFTDTSIGESLVELQLHYCRSVNDPMVRFLETTPKLERLELVGLFDIGQNSAVCLVIETLVRGPDEQPGDKEARSQFLCPLLKHINFSQTVLLQAGPVIRLIKGRNVKVNEDPSSTVSKIETLILDGCPRLDASILPWVRSKVPRVSCVYLSKRDASRRR